MFLILKDFIVKFNQYNYFGTVQNKTQLNLRKNVKKIFIFFSFDLPYVSILLHLRKSEKKN